MWQWLLATRFGRACIAVTVIAAAAAVLGLRLVALGRNQAIAKRAADRLEAISKRRAGDETVDQMGHDRLNDELARWMRDRR